MRPAVHVLPFVEVTKGDPQPVWLTLHPLAMAGGLVAVMRKVRNTLPEARKATYVP